MQTKYYNSSNNFKEPILREPKPYRESGKAQEVIPKRTRASDKKEVVHKEAEEKKSKFPIPFLNQLEIDDLLLLGLMFILLMDSEDEWLLLIALAYIFLSGR